MDMIRVCRQFRDVLYDRKLRTKIMESVSWSRFFDLGNPFADSIISSHKEIGDYLWVNGAVDILISRAGPYLP